MKFNLLVMLIIVALVSCDNIIIEGDANDFVESEGKPTYISLDFSTSKNTYAGETIVKGFADDLLTEIIHIK